ncbi:T9SS type A sorting domain-containing protein [Lacinutrix mariniflava]|uniref:T9SS type A sorting domain-containing protein n=1 Tax=Lacinutrix mariniflava TaxID=342955 RepID=UPI0006E175E4|nr:T9SS type A sorting domain-containing protein [Lacinutrix mariniflava]
MKKNYTLKRIIRISRQFWCLMVLFSFSAFGQNLNFTIDTAVDDGVGITETLTMGSDTYVLVIDVAGTEAETIIELSPGVPDLIFYLGNGTTTNPFIITLTKNGNPTNFKLNGMDYDTVEDGFISLVNQDDNEISANQEYLVGSGAITITNASNAANITEFKIIQPDVTDNTDFAFHNINIDVLDTLTTETFTSLDNEVSVLPNPSNGNIKIKNTGVPLQRITITDINGHKILTQNLNGATTDKNLDLSSKLSSGLYFMTIAAEDATTVKKLIIE